MVLPQTSWMNTWSMQCITFRKSPKSEFQILSRAKDFREQTMNLFYADSVGQSLSLLRKE